MANGFVRRLFVLALALFTMNAFASDRRDPHWEKRWWLEKTVRKLRGGEGLLPSEDADALLRLSKEQIVAKLMEDPRFADMVLDFNMYFLGFKVDQVKAQGRYDGLVYSFPAAITSARETFNDGDYFRFFDLMAEPYMEPLSIYSRSPGEQNMTPAEVIRARAVDSQARLQTLIDFAEKDPAATSEAVCQRYFQDNFGVFLLGSLGAGSAFNISAQTNKDFELNLEAACFLGLRPPVPMLAGYMRTIHAIGEKLFPALIPFAAPDYSVARLQDMQALDTSRMGFGSPWISWSYAQRFGLVNSSTNFNRKRAAYVLKRYFCDDLTPIAVENPQTHTRAQTLPPSGGHGSQTSCYACHYKLDPMAGFFRDYGFLFINFGGDAQLIFDDLATVERAKYHENWRAAAGSPRQWNVGYIRSVSDESINDYGSSLEDLHALFRTAPEVKRCLSRRAFEYMVSEKQTIDAGYLDYLSEEFTRRSAQSSGRAFKWLISTLALSNSFSQIDLEPEECYDRRPGTTPGSSPPCRVAFLFERNCVTCHSSTAGAGRLNLAGWITLPDGSQTFPHLDRAGHQRPARETFERLSDRLTTADENRRMPLGSFMTSQDRQEIYLWVQEQL